MYETFLNQLNLSRVDYTFVLIVVITHKLFDMLKFGTKFSMDGKIRMLNKTLRQWIYYTFSEARRTKEFWAQVYKLESLFIYDFQIFFLFIVPPDQKYTHWRYRCKIEWNGGELANWWYLQPGLIWLHYMCSCVFKY